VTQSWTYGNTGSTLNGDITGAVKLGFNAAGLTIGLGGNSSYTGGTTIAPGWKDAVNINVTSNTGMGAGAVYLDGYNNSNSANSSNINVNFKTAAPVIGSLASDGEGLANFVILGNTGVNTTLTVGALGTNTNFMGVIKDFAGQVGSLKKTGIGKQTLSGANTYTGTTTIDGGTLALGASGSLTTSGVGIDSDATFETVLQSYAMPTGQTFTFTLDPSGAGMAGLLKATLLTITNGSVSFNPLGTLNDTAYVIGKYSGLTGSNFASVSSLPAGYVLNYNYLGTGDTIALVAVPEPATLGLIGLGMFGLLRRTRRELQAN